MPNIGSSDLSSNQIDDFIEHGYVKLEQAFDAELAQQGRDDLWAAMGLSPNEPHTWTRSVIRLGFMSGPCFIAAANTPLLHGSYDALVGEARWLRPTGLGTFPIRFPFEDDPVMVAGMSI